MKSQFGAGIGTAGADRLIVAGIVSAIFVLMFYVLRASFDATKPKLSRRILALLVTVILALVVLALAELQFLQDQALIGLVGALIGSALPAVAGGGKQDGGS